VCTRAQGLFAHATTPGAPTIVVTQAKVVRYKHICASEPERTCARCSPSRPPSSSVCVQPKSPAFPACTSAEADQSQPLRLRPLNQKPNPSHAIPFIRIQTKSQDDAGGQGLVVAEPDGVHRLAFVFEL
jgi:hypothetical protein